MRFMLHSTYSLRLGALRWDFGSLIVSSCLGGLSEVLEVKSETTKPKRKPVTL